RGGRGADGATSGGQRRGGSRRASSDVVRGGSAPVWSSEGGYAAGRGASSESGAGRRRGSRRASRPAGAADRH
ncbi:ATP-dependent helicase, partial [Curtobacterium sp. A7_M15]|nr:ATP-dependent helicase [Curtobacterium sp. A7_M15]